MAGIGRKSVSDSVEGAVSHVIELSCTPAEAVGDPVRLDPLSAATAKTAADNSLPLPVIGVIIEKPSTTSCRVAVSGVQEDPSMVAIGVLYLGVSGGFSNTAPATGYRQKLGYSFGDGTYDMKPEKTLIKVN